MEQEQVIPNRDITAARPKDKYTLVTRAELEEYIRAIILKNKDLLKELEE